MGRPLSLTPPRCPRYASLDLWRGVACLFVLLHHATMYAHFGSETADAGSALAGEVVAVTSVLWLGVPLFFVISGYCISATADATRRRGHPLTTYFIRRFRRIYPPYWAALVVLVVLTGVVDRFLAPGLWSDDYFGIPQPDSLTVWQWLGNLTLTEKWRWHLVGGPPQLFHGLSWSLCYEEQFYAVVGLLLALAARRFFLGAAVATVLTMSISFLVPWTKTHGFFFDGHWLGFAAGILVYYRVNYAGRLGGWAITGLLLAGVLIYGWYFFPVRSPHANLGEANFVSLAFALLLLLLHPCDGRLAAAPLLRPLIFCGTMCYSLYLIHWPVVKGLAHGLYLAGVRSDTGIVLVTLPLSIAASVGASWVFYQLVEKRFLNVPQAK
jgi:peptidoglycan/LPS O-acetylase OafA/YrhL